MRQISTALRLAVAQAVEVAKRNRVVTLRLYQVAEEIRGAHAAENVALEDIAELLIAQIGPTMAIELDPCDARSAFLGSGGESGARPMNRRAAVFTPEPRHNGTASALAASLRDSSTAQISLAVAKPEF